MIIFEQNRHNSIYLVSLLLVITSDKRGLDEYNSGSTTNSVSHLVANEVPLASLSLAPIDIDEIAPLPGTVSRQPVGTTSIATVLSSAALDTSPSCLPPVATVTTPLSASRLRLLQDTTMIESALDLDSLEEASVGRGSQAGLIKMGAI